MNHFCAMQRRDKRWDYTQNGRPWGYCQEYKPIPEDSKWMPLDMIQKHNAKMEPLIGNFHTDGHATEEEACACYKKYLLDTDLRLMEQEPTNASQQHKCKACGAWTACYAMVGPYRMFVLCPLHQTREEVEKRLSVEESWES